MADPAWIHEHVIERIAASVKFPHEPNSNAARTLANEWMAVLRSYEAAVLERATTAFVRSWRNGWWPPIAEHMDFVREAHAARPALPRIETAAEQRAREVDRWLDTNRDLWAGCSRQTVRDGMLAMGSGWEPGEADYTIWRESRRQRLAMAEQCQRAQGSAADSLRMPLSDKASAAHRPPPPVDLIEADQTRPEVPAKARLAKPRKPAHMPSAGIAALEANLDHGLASRAAIRRGEE